MSLRITSLVLLLSMWFRCSVPAKEREVLRRSFLGKPSPELVFQDKDWMGKYPPACLADLKGKVVWLQFNF